MANHNNRGGRRRKNTGYFVGIREDYVGMGQDRDTFTSGDPLSPQFGCISVNHRPSEILNLDVEVKENLAFDASSQAPIAQAA